MTEPISTRTTAPARIATLLRGHGVLSAGVALLSGVAAVALGLPILTNEGNFGMPMAPGESLSLFGLVGAGGQMFSAVLAFVAAAALAALKLHRFSFLATVVGLVAVLPMVVPVYLIGDWPAVQRHEGVVLALTVAPLAATLMSLAAWVPWLRARRAASR